MLSNKLEVTITKNGEKIPLVIKPTNYKVEQELKTVYAIAYRKSIAMGVATRSSMIEILKREEVWGDKEDEALTKAVTSVTVMEVELARLIKDNAPIEQQKEAAIQLAKERSDLYALVQIKSAPLMHTAEAIAEDCKVDRYISLSTITQDGQLYFKDHDEFIARRNDIDVVEIYDAVLTELSKTNVELLRNFPENKWLVQNGMMTEDGDIQESHVKKILGELQEKEEVKQQEQEVVQVQKPKKKKKNKKQIPQEESA